MGIEDKGELQKLLDAHASAELRVRHAIGERHDAMYAVIDWVTAYAERAAGRVPVGTSGETEGVPAPISDTSGGN